MPQSDLRNPQTLALLEMLGLRWVALCIIVSGGGAFPFRVWCGIMLIQVRVWV